MKQIIVCLFICFFSPLYGWWDVPHMVIVEIAKTQLDPSVIQVAEQMVQYFQKDFPENNSLTTAACFPDDMTTLGLSGFKVWHGVLRPYNPDGILSEKEISIISSLTERNNLHSAIHQGIKTLKDPFAGKWEKCFMLCFLLHAVGDIHQPMHCVQLYNEAFPSGDLAGHRFSLTGIPFRNLHTLWDAAFGRGAKKMKRPLSADDQREIEDFARFIVDHYPPQAFSERNNMSVEMWSKESYEIAISHAYANLKPGATPSQEYLSNGEKVAYKQIALAGYRLANVLTEIFESEEER